MYQDINFIIDQKGQKIYYSPVEKQSGIGIAFNDRILALVNQKFIAYLNITNRKDIAQGVDSKKFKKKYALKDIRLTVPKNKQLTLFINDYEDDKDKPKSVKWVFRMKNVQLVKKWVELIEEQNSPYTTRKVTIEGKNETLAPPVQQKNPSIKQITKQLNKRGYNYEQKKQDRQQPLKQIQQKKRQSQISFKRDQGQILEQSLKKNQQQIKRQAEKLQLQNKLKQKQKNQQPNLSKILQKNIDFNKVQEQYEQYKKKSIIKPHKNPASIASNVMFSTKKQHFSNYFRPLPIRFNTDQPANHINDKYFESFIKFCEDELKNIIDDQIESNKQQQQKQQLQEHIYVRNGIIIKLIKSQLKQIPGNKNVCDEGALKSYLNQHKNLNYIWKIIAYDDELSKIFIMPMSCIIEYAGYFAYLTCQFDNSQQTNQQDYQDFSYYFEKLAKLSKIHRSSLENQQYIKFMKVGNKFVIYQATQFLPRYVNNATVIRAQLFKQIYKQQTNIYISKKGRREQQQQKKYFKQPLQQNIGSLAFNMQKLDIYVLHPRQFSRVFHENGLNINMMSKVYEKVSNNFTKSIIKTEALIRSFKMLFRKKMQQSTENPNKTAKRMLNILLSQNSQSEMMWKIVQLHSNNYFQLSLSKQQIDKGYLLMGLEHHLSLVIKTKYDSCSRIFQVHEFIQGLELQTKIKIGEFVWLDDLQQIQESEKSLILSQKLQLQTKGFPYYIKCHQNLRDNILEIYEQDCASNPLKHLQMNKQVYQSCDINLSYYRRQITRLYWLIQSKQITQQKLLNEINKKRQQIFFYYENFHPIFIQFTDVIVSYYLSQRQYEKGLQMAKKCLANIMQICGGNTMHIKLASNYFKMGNCFMQWRRYDDAIAHYKKSKNILEFNSFVNHREYALILQKLAMLYLSKNKDQQSIKLLEIAQQILEQNIQQNYTQIVNIFQLLIRCSSHDPSIKQNIFQKSIKMLKIGIEKQIITDQQTIKLIKIIMYVYFFMRDNQITNQFGIYVEKISDQLRKGIMDIEKGIRSIKQFIINDKLYDTLEGFADKAQLILAQKGKVYDQKGNRQLEIFESLIQSLILVTSEGFILGVLDQLF